MKEKGIRKKLVALIMVACLSVVCLGLAACGGSSSSSAASASSASASTSASASASSASASASSAASTTDKFVGKWILSAAEAQGLTMAGNFGELMGMTDSGTITLNADGTGDINLGDTTSALKWETTGSDTISLKAESAEEAVPVTYKDEALFLTMEQDGQTATAIFTQSGTYEGAKKIDMSKATPITSESDLLGTWNLTGINMMGVTVYGDAETISALGNGSDTTVTFKEGGVVDFAGTEGTWAITANGATVTSSDSTTGETTLPILKLEDGSIAFDMTEIMGGMEFVLVYEK